MPIDLNLGSAFGTAVNKSLLPWTLAALKVTQDDGSLVKVTNVLSPLDKQSSIKIANTRIANVYNTLAKGSIPIGNQAANTTGQAIFVELNATASKVVGSDTILLPMIARIELKLPNDGELTNGNVEQLLLATYAALCDAVGTMRATEIMRGVLFVD